MAPRINITAMTTPAMIPPLTGVECLLEVLPPPEWVEVVFPGALELEVEVVVVFAAPEVLVVAGLLELAVADVVPRLLELAVVDVVPEPVIVMPPGSSPTQLALFEVRTVVSWPVEECQIAMLIL
jgi:hypothetical protein